ncbi:MAG TPA: glycosyltransferase family 4 protein [Wenzhouxiangella sp.]|nr:glycosyltransferase family 4 protein [Wenzhouxiangella sp.]
MNIIIPALGLERNGGNRVLIAVANALAASGATCEFLVPGGCEQPGFSLAPEIAVTAITRPRGNKVVRWLLFMLAAVPRLRGQNILANHFVTALSAVLATRFRRRSFAWLVQDLEYRFYPAPLSWLAWLACRLAWRRAIVLPANPYLHRQLKKRGVAAEPPLALGVAQSFIETPRSESRDLDVLMMLRHGRHKRLDRYRQIAADLHARGISVAAIAPETALFEPFGDSLHTCLVPDSDKQIVALMDRCRIFLLASEHEGFALPPLEAMARGLAVVTFPAGGPSVYVKKDVNAAVVDDCSEQTAVSVIEELLSSHDKRARLAANGRLTAQEYSLESASRLAAGTILELPWHRRTARRA